MKETVLIIGGGLCGSLLAVRLAQRGYQVELVESRPDLRSADISAGRSINLAFSNRGIKAMDLVGLSDQVNPLCIPMLGRNIHDVEQNEFMSPYSGRDGEFINSVSRGGLNGVLLTAAESHEKVNVRFNTKCKSVDLENKKALFDDNGSTLELSGDVIIGTDGAGSVLRQEYYLGNKFLFNFSRQFLRHGYKELTIPPSESGDFRIRADALHIWPRGGFMLIALPNLDKSFTVTLFLPFSEGEFNFEQLNTAETVRSFFQSQFPDAIPHMPDLETEFFENPTGPLGTVKCSPWSYKGNTLIMGDAAHAIVPFYGQGMNASFEDVVVLDSILDKYEGDWEKVFREYEKTRKRDSDAIADLAIDNFYEMRDHVANPAFKKKREIEMRLEKAFPDKYYSKYSMVTFREDIPYHQAMEKGRAQDSSLLQLIAKDSSGIDQMDTGDLLNYVNTEAQRIVSEQNQKAL